MIDFVALLSAFGVGAILTALIQSYLNLKQYKLSRDFQEKKEAFIGLLEAYHKAAVNPSDQNAKNFAYWQMRCELVANKEVIDAIEKMVLSNDNKELRSVAHNELKIALKKNLGVG